MIARYSSAMLLASSVITRISCTKHLLSFGLSQSRSHVLRHGLSQHWDQLGAGFALHDVSARTSRDCLPCELARLGQAHDENLSQGKFMLYAAGGLKAVHQWHRYVY